MSRICRYRGALLGLAVGDALGTTLEFQSPGTFKPIKDMIGGGPFNLEPGQWTDDTSMALCLAESLIVKHGFDPQDQLARYIQWYRHGHWSSTGTCFDIGTTTAMALHEFERSGKPFCGPTDPRYSGNGSIMRLAPVPLFYAQHPIMAIEQSGESSRTTHGSRTCIDACRYMGALIVGAVNGASKAELLDKHYCPVPGYWEKNPLVSEIDAIAAGSFTCKNPPEIKGTGYVANTLEAAMWGFYKSTSFADGLLMVVNLGDDADTTGAVYGQLAGAFYGDETIPKKWLTKLFLRDKIQSFAEELLRVSDAHAGA